MRCGSGFNMFKSGGGTTVLQPGRRVLSGSLVLCVKGTVPLRSSVSRPFGGSLRDETGVMMREEDRHAADYCQRGGSWSHVWKQGFPWARPVI